jgi:hypothetical protein
MKYKTTGREKTNNGRVTLIQLHTFKSFNNNKKKLNGRSHQIPININTECQWTQIPHQKTAFGKLD